MEKQTLGAGFLLDLCHTLVSPMENTCSQSGIMSPAPNPGSPLVSSSHGAKILLQTYPPLPGS